ncbi:MAG: hypothetical protein D6814_09150 [Calditrichaeota bacterium]|nr:MAG: hypothetical protein D6814_09150 [Calditrichota bacterium]
MNIHALRAYRSLDASKATQRKKVRQSSATFHEQLQKAGQGSGASKSAAKPSAPAALKSSLEETDLTQFLSREERQFLNRLFRGQEGLGCYRGNCQKEKATVLGMKIDVSA